MTAVQPLAGLQEREPLAQAIARHALNLGITLAPAEDVLARPGQDAQGRLQGVERFIASPRFLAETGPAARPPDLAAQLASQAEMPGTALLLWNNRRELGRLALEDRVRPQPAHALAERRAAGVCAILMPSGDNGRTAARIARQTGVTDARPALLPEDKARVSRAWCAQISAPPWLVRHSRRTPGTVTANIAFALGTKDISLSRASSRPRLSGRPSWRTWDRRSWPSSTDCAGCAPGSRNPAPQPNAPSGRTLMAHRGPARRHRFVAIWRWLLILAFLVGVFAMRAPARAQDMPEAASVQTSSAGPVQMEAAPKLEATPRSETAPPQRKVRVSSGFGKRRDPINKRKRFHRGVDISRPAGTEVFAWLEGVVAHKGWKGKYGLTVDILHENGLVSRYAHLKEAAVVSGQPIEAGQLVGLIGRTGRTTGPNLHFEVLIGNKRSDPRKLPIDFSQIVGEGAGKSRRTIAPEDILRPEAPFMADPADAHQSKQVEDGPLSIPAM